MSTPIDVRSFSPPNWWVEFFTRTYTTDSIQVTINSMLNWFFSFIVSSWTQLGSSVDAVDTCEKDKWPIWNSPSRHSGKSYVIFSCVSCAALLATRQTHRWNRNEEEEKTRKTHRCAYNHTKNNLQFHPFLAKCRVFFFFFFYDVMNWFSRKKVADEKPQIQ